VSKIRKGIILSQALIKAVMIVSAISMLIIGTSYAQNSTVIGSNLITNNQNQIELSKVATSTIMITNKTAFVGGFDTKYNITGTPVNIKESKDLIFSSIVEDFGKSSTVGYVKISKSVSNFSGKTEIGNPFASNEQINQRIQELLSKSIENATSSNPQLIEITCLFGNSLDAFSCSAFPLLS
jgi:hypothetical protein